MNVFKLLTINDPSSQGLQSVDMSDRKREET